MPLPDKSCRSQLMNILLETIANRLTAEDAEEIVDCTEGKMQFVCFDAWDWLLFAVFFSLYRRLVSARPLAAVSRPRIRFGRNRVMPADLHNSGVFRLCVRVNDAYFAGINTRRGGSPTVGCLVV